MRYRRLGRTELQVSELGYGAAWGASQDRAKFIATVHAAIESGVNFVDTATDYGNGDSERALGEALRGHSKTEFRLWVRCTSATHRTRSIEALGTTLRVEFTTPEMSDISERRREVSILKLIFHSLQESGTSLPVRLIEYRKAS